MWRKRLSDTFWDLVNWRHTPAALRRFTEMPVLMDRAEDVTTVSADTWRKLPRQEQGNNYVTYAKNLIRTARNPIKFIDDDSYLPSLQSATRSFETIKLHNSGRKILLTDKRVGLFRVSDGSPEIELVRCHIDKIAIDKDSHTLLKLRDCWVRSFDMGKAGIRHLEIHGGGILALHCLPASSENPFTGPVVIKNLYLPRSAGTNMNPQRLRDIRGHLTALHNTLAAGVFHGAELALDRPNESWWNRRFNWLYEVMADYGNSTTRPIVSFLVLLAIMTAMTFALDNPFFADGESKGWRSAMACQTMFWEIARSFIYAFSAVFNPLGVVNSKPLLLLSNPIVVFAVAIVGFFATLCLAFLVIAIRRRFKLE